MDENRYQIDLLNAINEKLDIECNMYRAVVDTSTSAFLYYSFEEDRFQTLGDWNHYFETAVQSKKDLSLLYQEIDESFLPAIKELFFIDQTEVDSSEQVFKKRDSDLWIRCSVNVSHASDGKPSEKVIRFEDISKQKKQNDEMAYMAYYDYMTNMYNRNHFVQTLMEWVSRAEAESAIVSVAFIDIDDFKKINDGMGILEGDELLQAFGSFLSELCEDDDRIICGHFDSDLFCIAIYNPSGKRSISAIYDEIRERNKRPFRLSKEEVSISVSVGVAEYPEAAKTALELIGFAQIMMYQAKESGKSEIRYFDTPVINQFVRSTNIENRLKLAAANNELVLHYQPQYEAGTGRLRGVEALVRWRYEGDKLMYPGEFIPIAERSNLIIDIGDWVMDKALSMLATWQKEYDEDFTMSINISPIQFKRDDFVRKLLRLLSIYDVNPAGIELELTETVLADDLEAASKKMDALCRHGIQFAIDDFGTGYSSLSYLSGLPVHTIKVDKSFVDSIARSDPGTIIIESIVHMVNKLGYKTVAEGVERQEQYDYLNDIGCGYIQGFLLDRPMSEEQIDVLLKKRV
ncbi:MAG: bifunctional diguanylate cyclase/phosphodiesterase [Lachnospiraceae bacterium]|nr:bifunctional diguanylate cyclase/phosphodiesterase [Lachnospiraceae bacterium]